MIVLWLKNHVWLCSYVVMGLAVLTFLLNFIIKKSKHQKEQTIKNVKNSTVNQAGGDIKTEYSNER